MTARTASLLATAAIAIMAFFPSDALAQAAPAAGGSIHDQIQALRQLVEQQSRQIQVLSDQVARLTATIENRAAGAPVAGNSRPADFVVPVARPAAPPPPPANVHIVVKNDSLDKIARTYNTTVADLLKLNKITDAKKLQIGQQIILPPGLAPVPPPAPPGAPGQ